MMAKSERSGSGYIGPDPDLGLPRVVWSRDVGWLNVRDPGDGSWHSIPAKDAPRGWLDLARESKKSSSQFPSLYRESGIEESARQ